MKIDIKKLNEEIQGLIEKEVSPEFVDRVKQYSDQERNRYKRDADRYKQNYDSTGDDWYKDAFDDVNKKANAKNMKADKVYQYLADHGVDVQNCKIETLNGSELKSKDLKKLYFNAKKDEQTKVILLVPAMENFQAYELYTTYDGKFAINDLMPNTYKGVEDAVYKPHSLKTALNSGIFEGKQLFLVSGPDLRILRMQRRQSQKDMVKRYKDDEVPHSVETDGDIQWAFDNDWSFLDKSGYIVDYAAIKRKLMDYKKQKGSYSKDVDEILNGYEELMGKVKELFTNYDPRQGTSTDLPRIMDKMNNLGYTLQKIDSNLETPDNGTSLKNHIDEAKRRIENIKTLL